MGETLVEPLESASAGSACTVNAPIAPLQRNVAVDAYRGLVMLLMMGEALHFWQVPQSFSHSLFWRVLGFDQSHVQWVRMSLHDTIQPSFTFLVGVALPCSLRSWRRKGENFQRMLGHSIWRSFLIVALGIFLRSTHSTSTYFTFQDTLTQIGFGYKFAFLLTFARHCWQWTALGVVLFGHWLAWSLHPVPGPNFPYASVGVPAYWQQHLLHGFASRWDKNANMGQVFDLWFLNLFPRTTPFVYNDGGHLTLRFIPTLGTMLLGLAAGRWSIASPPSILVRKFLIVAAALIGTGPLLNFAGISPIVKRIWTPAWTLFSGGMCFLFLAAFSWFIDAKSTRVSRFLW